MNTNGLDILITYEVFTIYMFINNLNGVDWVNWKGRIQVGEGLSNFFKLGPNFCVCVVVVVVVGVWQFLHAYKNFLISEVMRTP